MKTTKNELRIILTSVALIAAMYLMAIACTKEQAANVISAGSGAGQVICAVMIDEQKVEHEICDTGVKLAELLASLLRPKAAAPETARSASPTPSAVPSTNVGPMSVETQQPSMKIVRFYVKQ